VIGASIPSETVLEQAPPPDAAVVVPLFELEPQPAATTASAPTSATKPTLVTIE
jgi:hypothetical protein